MTLTRLCTPREWQDFQQDFPGAFVALWTGGGLARALFAETLIAVPLDNGAYPALSPRHPGALWFERLAHDLNGHQAIGADLSHPAIAQSRGPDGAATWPDFPKPAGAGAHQIAMGPVHGRITEPAHFRFAVRGETVLGLTTRLGYAHKGTLGLMHGKSPRLAARFAARISGDSTVAHSLAFAHAAEAALALRVPPRALFLRAVMAELERIANHAGDIAQVAEAAGFPWGEARLNLHREAICAAALAAFGHRLMMDMVIPGGLAADIATGGAAIILQALEMLEAELPALARMFEDRANLRDRLDGLGVIPPAVAAAHGAGGYVGRASGRRADARLSPGYPPYPTLGLRVPTETAGDVAARIRIRFAELAESIRLIQRLLAELPDSLIAAPPPAGSGEGCGVAESFRGAAWAWMRLESGMIAEAFVADPSALHWPLLEYAARGGAVADFPLIERSVNASCSGVDL